LELRKRFYARAEKKEYVTEDEKVAARPIREKSVGDRDAALLVKDVAVRQLYAGVCVCCVRVSVDVRAGVCV